MTLKKIEQLIFIFVLGALFVPLGVETNYIIINVWHIPAFFLVVISVLRFVLKDGWSIRRWDLWDLSIIGIILSLLISTLLGPNLSDNFPALTRYFTIFILAFYVRRAWGRLISVKTIVLFAIIGILVQSITGIIQFLTFSQFGNFSALFGSFTSAEVKGMLSASISRVQGTVGQPNVVGNWIIALFPFVYIAPYLNNFYHKYIWIVKRITVGLGVICLFMTFSRGNIAIFIFMCTIFFIPWSKYYLNLRWSKLQLLNRVVGGAIVLVLIVSLSINYNNKISSAYNVLNNRVEMLFTSSGTSAATASFRLKMDKAALEVISEHPIVGLGFQNSKYIWDRLAIRMPSWWEARPHNIYLTLGAEGGIFAFIFYGLFTCLPIYYLLRKVKGRNALSYAYLFSLIAVFLVSQMYIIVLSPKFNVLYAIIIGGSMGYIDENLNKYGTQAI